MEEFEQLYLAAKNWKRALIVAVIGAVGSLAGVAIDGYFDYQTELIRSENQAALEARKLEVDEKVALCDQVFDYLEDEKPNPIVEGDLGRSLNESMEGMLSNCLGQAPSLSRTTGQ